MSSARTALRERVAALGRARRAIAAGRLEDAEHILHEELSRWPGNRDAQTLLAEVTRSRGSRPGHAVAAPAVQRPKAGGPEAWASFEARVRERKVTRLAERARAALAAGAITDALAAVEEIETLAPGHPVLDELPLPHPTPHAASPAAAPTPPAGEPTDPSASTWPSALPPLLEVEPGCETGRPSLEPEPAPAAGPVEWAPLPQPEPGPNPLVLDPGEVRIDRPLPVELEDAPDTTAASRPSTKERLARGLGLVLVVGSVVALSGWAGYQWFAPDLTGPAEVEQSTRTGPDEPTPLPPTETDGPPTQTDAPAEPTGTGGRETPPPAVSPPNRAAAPAPAAATPPTPSQDAQARAPEPAPTPVDPPPTTRRADDEEQARTERGAETPPAPSQPETPSEVASTAAQQPAPIVTPAPLPAPEDPPAAAPEPPAPATSGAPAAGASGVAESNEPNDTPPGDASAMRGLIEGYLAGYNNLDAGGVHSVWPAVDRRALARAFGQLASQRLVFSRCEVRAAGSEGHGFCVGRASWRPRVGGGERTERRVWRFDFEERAGRWAIDAVEIER